METKYCKYCDTTKALDEFRNKLDKRDGRIYKNNSCLTCDKRMQLQRHNKKKLDPEYRKKNCERAKKYSIENKEIILSKQKERRQAQSYKENRKKYIQNNKEKIRSQEYVCKMKYANYHKENLTDRYVVSKLCGKNFGHLKKDFEGMPLLIEAKRQQLRLIRLLTSK